MAAHRPDHPAAPGLTLSMPIPSRRFRVLLLSLASVIIAIAIPLHSPPDGQDRSEFAQFVGRFHPLVVHLPIALLLLVPVLELAAMTRRWKHLRGAAEFV